MGPSSECRGDVTLQQGDLPSCEVSPARLCNRDRTDDRRIPPDDRLWRVLFTLLGSAAHDLDALRVASADGHVGCPDRSGSARVVWRSGGYGYVPTRAALDGM
jgi:hypothetical protein